MRRFSLAAGSGEVFLLVMRGDTPVSPYQANPANRDVSSNGDREGAPTTSGARAHPQTRRRAGR